MAESLLRKASPLRRSSASRSWIRATRRREAVLSKPNDYNQAREKSVISDDCPFRSGRLFRTQGRRVDRAVSLQLLRGHWMVRARSVLEGMQKKTCRWDS